MEKAALKNNLATKNLFKAAEHGEEDKDLLEALNA